MIIEVVARRSRNHRCRSPVIETPDHDELGVLPWPGIVAAQGRSESSTLIVPTAAAKRRMSDRFSTEEAFAKIDRLAAEM